MTGERAVDTDAIRVRFGIPTTSGMAWTATAEKVTIRSLCDEIDRLRSESDPALRKAADEYREAWEADDGSFSCAYDENQARDALLRVARGES